MGTGLIALVEAVKSLVLLNVKEHGKVPYQTQKPRIKSMGHGVYLCIAQCLVPTIIS